MKANLYPLQNRGMSRDLSVSKAENTFAWENINVRITANDDDTLLSVTNERGTKALTTGYTYRYGALIGWNVFGSHLILFFHQGTTDTILRVDFEDDGDTVSVQDAVIYSGNLHFSNVYGIESVISYESEEVQKIYWVDGVNVLRCCNFMQTYTGSDNTIFDSTRGAQSQISVSITKDNGGATRPNGTIQYLITAYNKLGVETGPLYYSPLVYLSPFDRGGAADGTNSNRVRLSIADSYGIGFEYLRVYAIQRTSYNGPITAYIVAEMPVATNALMMVYVLDTGANYLASVDATQLLYLSSKEVVPYTMAQKDNTLFLGNLKVKSNDYDALDAWARTTRGEDGISSVVTFANNYDDFRIATPKDTYSYNNQLQQTSEAIKIFKAREKYRFAVVFRKDNGDRSKAFWIGDAVSSAYPSMFVSPGRVTYQVPTALIPTTAAKNLGYTYAQLYMAQATYADRSVKAQGFINPTVYNLFDRYNDQPYARPSWTARPALGNVEFMHMHSLRNSNTMQGEMQSNWWDSLRPRSYYQKSGSVITGYVPEAWTSRSDDLDLPDTTTGLKILMLWNFNSSHTTFMGWIEYFRTETPLVNGAVPEDAVWYERGLIQISGDQPWANFKARILQICEDDAVLRRYYQISDSALESIKSALPSGGQAREQVGEQIYVYGTGVDVEMDSSALFCKYSRQHYFVDTNIVTLHSPEIEYEKIDVDRNKKGLKLRIIGAAQMSSSITDHHMQVVDTEYVGNNEVQYDYSTPYGTTPIGTLTAAPMYYDSIIGLSDDGDYFNTLARGYHMTYMWHKTGSMINYTDGSGKVYSSLVSKRFANMQYAHYTYYSTDTVEFNTLSDIRQVTGGSSGVYEFTTMGQKKLYSVNVPATVIMPPEFKYPVYFSDNPSNGYGGTLAVRNNTSASDPVQVTYNSRPHVLLSLPASKSSSAVSSISVLPARTGSNGNDVFSLDSEFRNNYMLLEPSGVTSIASVRLTAAMVTEMRGAGLRLEFDGGVLDGAGIYSPAADRTRSMTSSEVDTSTGIITSTQSDIVAGNVLRIRYIATSNARGVAFYSGTSSTGVDIYGASGNLYLGWEDNVTVADNDIQQSTLNVGTFDANSSYLWIAELYDDFSGGDNRYGGATESAAQNNVFIPCGPEVFFGSSNSVMLYGKEGDTYFQRYDCLLAYPQSENDVNQVVDIASVMLETHVNIDGRTDKDRGVGKLADIDYTNFGTLNPVYQQENNFTQAMAFDERFNSGLYPSTYTWTKEKHPLETNDTWMNITLASTSTVDMAYGKINAIRNFRNTLVAFQDKAISELLFNARVQIPVSDGVPVEISNSSKAGDKRIISNQYGCLNKWSIVEGKNGLYFKDDIAKEIARFDGQGIEPLSSKAKLNTWVKGKASTKVWSPSSFNNTVSYYDRVNSDVYFVHDPDVGELAPCLVYNEKLGTFVGLFSYWSLPMMTTIGNHLVSYYSSDLWLQNEGLYNNFYGAAIPSSVTYRITPDAFSDKIWSNIEYRADFMTVLDVDGSSLYEEGDVPSGGVGEYQPDVTFDKVRIWNEYQDTGDITMSWGGPGSAEDSDTPDIRKKFRIWRADIPRDIHSTYGLDRIRNPWIWLKLTKEFKTPAEQCMRMELHDIVVKYFTNE